MNPLEVPMRFLCRLVELVTTRELALMRGFLTITSFVHLANVDLHYGFVLAPRVASRPRAYRVSAS
jgi:hypothetical protein